MCRNLGLCCWLLLFVASPSDPQGNFTNDNEQSENLTLRYDELYVNSTKSERMELIRYNSRENSTKDYDEVQYESHTNTMTNNRENDDSTQYGFRVYTMKSHEESNSMDPRSKINNDSNSTLYEPRNPDIGDDNDNIISYEMCDNSECIQLCCPLGDHLIQEECVAGKGYYSFSGVYRYATNDSSQSEDKRLDQVFRLVVRDPCLETGRRLLDPENSPDDEYVLFANGSLYRPQHDEFIPSTSYCLAVVKGDNYDVAICKNKTTNEYPMFISISILVSLPFLLMTFIVYTILPEFQNMHGYTLRAHVASLFITYMILPFFHQVPVDKMGYSVCVPLAFILNFSFTASFLWLNAICFDIWCTFSIFRLANVKHLERKKFIMYSIYAWGSASMLTIICAIMDYVPSIPRNLVRPELCRGRFWFSKDNAKTLYFYLPMGITVLCNICLFIATALKIACQKKNTAHHLRDSESVRHDDNKQRFNMYLKLFILMGISWIMEIVSWVDTSLPDFVWYPTDMINSLQGFIIFVIFVWRRKIKRLLLKRLDWQNCSLFGRNSKSKDCYTVHDRYTSTITRSGTVCLQEIN